MLPKVAIVGRPNVGKSALFNRLTGDQKAIVEGEPYVTRDRIYSRVWWNNREFELIDTGGIDPFARHDFRVAVLKQTRYAIKEAELLLLVVDLKEGLTPLDIEVAELLRKAGKPVLLIGNKEDTKVAREKMPEFYSLSLGEVFPVSALHGINIGDLLDDITRRLTVASAEEEKPGIAIAIAGRPNVGKSSLLNALLGEERAVVDAVAGTTRDAVDSYLDYRGEQLILIDTAGLKKRGKQEKKVEYYSWVRARKAIQRADLVLLMLDAESGILTQDKKIAGFIKEEGKGSVIVVNKWDLKSPLLPGKMGSRENQFMASLSGQLGFLGYSPFMFISALKGWNIQKLLPLCLEVYQRITQKIPAKKLNNWLREVICLNPPRGKGGKGAGVRLQYFSQVGVKPPRFLLKGKFLETIPAAYFKYLEGKLRQSFDFTGAPLIFLTGGRK